MQAVCKDAHGGVRPGRAGAEDQAGDHQRVRQGLRLCSVRLETRVTRSVSSRDSCLCSCRFRSTSLVKLCRLYRLWRPPARPEGSMRLDRGLRIARVRRRCWRRRRLRHGRPGRFAACRTATRSATRPGPPASAIPLDLPRELNKTTMTEYRVEPGDGLLVLPARSRIQGPPARRPDGIGRRHDRSGQVRSPLRRRQDGAGDREAGPGIGQEGRRKKRTSASSTSGS